MDGLNSSSQIHFTQFLFQILEIVPKIPVMSGITITYIFHNFSCSSLTRSRYLSWFLLSFIFTLWSARMAKSTRWQIIFFLLIKTDWTGLDNLFVSQSPREFYASHFLKTDSGLCIYYLPVWSNFSLLHNFQLITFLTLLYLHQYSSCVSSLIWLTVLSLSPHSQQLPFSGMISIFALI